MGKAKILGFRPYNFTDEKTGRPVRGVSLYTGEIAENVTGYECTKQSLKVEVFEGLVKQAGNDANKLINRDTDLVYDKRGKVVQANLLS